MKRLNLKPEDINNILPQTQCELCDYSGCRPYAEAIVYKNESIDRCLPGGVDVLKQLADLTKQDATPFIEGMQQKQKPQLLAVIRESECIGCKKCIQTCPVDAILGTSKHMHTVISDECSGCELCVEPCPVDCIDMIEIPEYTVEQKKQKAAQYKARYEFRQLRLQREKREQAEAHRKLKFASVNNQSEKLQARKDEIQAVLARVKRKKHER